MSFPKGHQYSALHHAAQSGDLEGVRAAIQRGQRLSRFDEIGHTPLHYAVAGEHLAVVEALIGAGANVNAIDHSVGGSTPFGLGASSCSLEMAELLINAGADPTLPGRLQISALETARQRTRGDGPAIYKLLEAAAQQVRDR